jgi:hypothetical protein
MAYELLVLRDRMPLHNLCAGHFLLDRPKHRICCFTGRQQNEYVSIWTVTLFINLCREAILRYAAASVFSSASASHVRFVGSPVIGSVM